MLTSVNAMPSRPICALRRLQYPHHEVVNMVTEPGAGAAMVMDHALS